jgi:3-deoxy-D-manno-octulosonic acid (KDO) 8-phosphate synthase
LGEAGFGPPRSAPEYVLTCLRSQLLQVRNDPPTAKSDGANALNLKDLAPLLESLLAIHAAAYKSL